LSEFDDFAQIADFEDELRDRFGELPEKAAWLLMYFKLNILSKQAGLQNCHVRHNTLTLEFRPDKLPAKEKILAFSAQVKYELRFEATKGLKMFIYFPKEMEYREQFEQSLQLLEKFISAGNQKS